MRHLLCLSLLVSTLVHAQPRDFAAPASTTTEELDRALPALAREVMATYQEQDPGTRLGHLFRLQLTTGDFGGAVASIQALRPLRETNVPLKGTTFLQYEIHAKARLEQATHGTPYAKALRAAFQESFGALDDRTAQQATGMFRFDLERARTDLETAVEGARKSGRVTQPQALDLVRLYQVHRAYQALLAESERLWAEDDARRYVIEKDVLVPTPDGASVSVIVVRPRKATDRLPTVMSLTIYVNAFNLSDAVRSAAHGYAGVTANSRGKRNSPQEPVPFEHDGADAIAVIDWVSRQPWSDGQVGMFGGSYEGFTQWSAAKRGHPALKTIMPSVPVAPGIDVPMQGNVFQNFFYKWPRYVTLDKGLADADYFDRARWDALDERWYTSGEPYRAMEKLDGRPNPFFQRWLKHPTYDAYWRKMIPYRDEFARVRIPVLTTTGYYDGCSLSAMYYLTEHLKYAKEANHTFVIGPYDHVGGQHVSSDELRGYRIDPVARLDVEALRYQWMDHVLRKGPRPALLEDRINYQVMGANTWRHAHDLGGVSNDSLTLYLAPAASGDTHLLTARPPAPGTALRQRVDFKERSPGGHYEPWNIVDTTVAAHNGFAFVSEPLPAPVELSGLFSGRLDFISNKKDFDFSVVLYERTAKGEYVYLSYLLNRASHVGDRTRRRLLVPGKKQSLSFQSGRMTSRKLETGSQLVIVLAINKHAQSQLNLGTGKDVSDESIADAKVPLDISWLGGSRVVLPLWREPPPAPAAP
ncbi:hydrolase, coce/nond family [Myxococcus stipitatus DSM 14675]|uniref:Hydrolase, coce/nond family n=1 Tax=Myxococcus stipitatus (strain DSM 14675 / JCM 12634 / Mx s8) TaxID=1278073 RepID=L7U4N6_MYXSD|nr:CocE/NonD family hydrolase [Myxococcus stipitatus]AGC43791.1 hydrolase, coce/nond family [Myxococcus stipitatus DSM 14675]